MSPTSERRPWLTCTRCGKDTGNNHQGHYWRFCKALAARGVPTHAAVREPHFCCPGDCELEPSTSTPVGPAPAPEWITEIVPALLSRRADLRAAGLDPVGVAVPERLRDDDGPLEIACGLPVTWSTGETIGLIVGVS